MLQIAVFHQGVDPSLFAVRSQNEPKGERRRQDGLFYVFSGGKLEFRKGQDLLVAAFRQFYRTHPNARLVTAWANPWYETVETLAESRHVQGLPAAKPANPTSGFQSGELELEQWLAANGIPKEVWARTRPCACLTEGPNQLTCRLDKQAVIDLGRVSHGEMVLRMLEADVAVFPNRCEGGTNLMAMEAAAVGIPLIISANTGHLDLIRFLDGMGAISVTQQDPLDPTGSGGRRGWGEVHVEALVEALVSVSHSGADGPMLREAADRASLKMANWTWAASTRGLVDILVGR